MHGLKDLLDNLLDGLEIDFEVAVLLLRDLGVLQVALVDARVLKDDPFPLGEDDIVVRLQVIFALDVAARFLDLLLKLLPELRSAHPDLVFF